MSDHSFINIQLSELWKQFEDKKADEEFFNAVAEVCCFGISKNANRNPLVHLVKADTVTHICNMLANLKKLVDYTKITLTAEHLACLLMAACCYEIGINLTEKETEKYYGNYDSSEWKDFFKNHTKVSDYYAANKKVTDADRRLFLAQNQSKTMQTIFKEFKWNKILNRSWIYKETIFYLCGNLQLNESVLNKITQGNLKEDDLKRCAALLRFADIMTLNANRMSEHTIRRMQKISDDYWGNKPEDYNWNIDKDGIIQVGAICQTMQVEHELRTFLDWAGRELRQLNKAFKELPFVINSFIEPQGYTSGKFCITMEQDRILELLVGDNLYKDNYVFIRELLQNAIDAVHARVEFDKDFSEADGKVSMYSWQDEEGYTWFRIEDNGIGMTEDVVRNYFLKVGSSYYSSEHFEAEKLKYNANSNYNPISRFGIGILSCFMGDRDNTILEVSTKHFSKEKEQPVIRLDVTGLHGYYYLAKGNEVDESDFRPMHKMPDCEESKQDIGTSISIRMGMGFREEDFGVREIVEKYVHFPAVNVSFQDEKGTRKFTTKQELMEKVYALNPDGCGKPLKKYIFPLPEETKAEMKKELPDLYEWQEEPKFAISFRPLDWFSPTEEITGVQIICEPAGKVKLFKVGAFTFEPRIDCSLGGGLNFKIEAVGGILSKKKHFSNEQREEFSRQNRELEKYGGEFEEAWDYSVTIPYDYLSECVRSCFDIKELPQIKDGEFFTTSFDGVAADRKALWETRFRTIGTFLLLSGNMRPVVDISRGGIQSFDLKALCCLTSVIEKTDGYKNYGKLASNNNNGIYATERELFKILKEYPLLEKHLERELKNPEYYKKISENVEEVYIEGRQNLWRSLQIACIKKKGELVRGQQVSEYEYEWFIYHGQQDESTLDFPAGMFCTFKNSDAFYSKYPEICNKNHPLSQWLIKNQKGLIEKVPRLYNNLIHKIMRGGYDVDRVNKILKQINTVTSNAFNFINDLYLTEDDIEYI